MNLSQLILVAVASVLPFSAVSASELNLQILVCGTLQTSPNLANGFNPGAAVITTTLRNVESVFRLQNTGHLDDQIEQQLQAYEGELVTVFGLAQAESRSSRPANNPDGSIDLVPQFVVRGCKK